MAETAVSRTTAAVTGLLATGAGLACAELAAGLLGLSTTPVLAVGAAFIDVIPTGRTGVRYPAARHCGQAGPHYRHPRRSRRDRRGSRDHRGEVAPTGLRPPSRPDPGRCRGCAVPTRRRRGGSRSATARRRRGRRSAALAAGRGLLCAHPRGGSTRDRRGPGQPATPAAYERSGRPRIAGRCRCRTRPHRVREPPACRRERPHPAAAPQASARHTTCWCRPEGRRSRAVEDAQQRLLPHRHRPVRPAGPARGLAAAHPRHGRPAAGVVLRRPAEAPDRAPVRHTRLRQQRSRW